MAKTAGHEWRGVHCKAVDLAPGFDSPALAGLIVNEFFERNPTEVGLSPEGRTGVVLEPAGDVGVFDADRWSSSAVTWLSSAAMRRVTAQVAVALAESFGPSWSFSAVPQSRLQNPAGCRVR